MCLIDANCGADDVVESNGDVGRTGRVIGNAEFGGDGVVVVVVVVGNTGQVVEEVGGDFHPHSFGSIHSNNAVGGLSQLNIEMGRYMHCMRELAHGRS